MTSESHWLIIGGSKGLGRVLARQALELGRVSAVARSQPESPVEGVRYLEADITESESLRKAIDAARERGPLTTLALVQRYRGDGDTLDGELQTTLVGARDAIEACAPLLEDGGSIVVMSSIASRLVLADQPLGYHVARAGVEQLVRYYAVTLGERGIRVNAVSSGSFIKPESEPSHCRECGLVSCDRATSATPANRSPESPELRLFSRSR